MFYKIASFVRFCWLLYSICFWKLPCVKLFWGSSSGSNVLSEKWDLRMLLFYEQEFISSGSLLGKKIITMVQCCRKRWFHLRFWISLFNITNSHISHGWVFTAMKKCTLKFLQMYSGTYEQTTLLKLSVIAKRILPLCEFKKVHK